MPTPTPAPTTTAVTGTCAAAVTDKSNTGLISDCNALLAARDTLRGTATLNWAPDTPIARWNGITLGSSPQRVTKIKLHKKGLSGQLPAEIGNLPMLEELWLYTNQLSGIIPPEMGDLANLRWLFVSSNNLSGQIPQTLNGLSLDRLWLHRNSFTRLRSVQPHADEGVQGGQWALFMRAAGGNSNARTYPRARQHRC